MIKWDMVHYLQPADILKLCDNLCDVLQPESTNWQLLQTDLHAHIHEVAHDPETRYTPSHKWLEFISDCVDHTVTIAEEHQLRANEARAMLRQVIGKDTPVYQKFKLDAALERARYEPIMLQENADTNSTEREQLLMKRWGAMKTAQQAHDPISQDMLETLDESVVKAVSAPCFANYRVGPMLQFFTEMLQTANRLHRSNRTSDRLTSLIDTDSNLWKRYALKSARFEEPEASQAMSLMGAHHEPNQPLH